MKKYVITPQNPNGSLVDMTAEEISQREIETVNLIAEKQARETAKTTAEANKTSAKSKLEALGLTTEEIKALIGV